MRRDLDFHSPVSLTSGFGVIGCHGQGFPISNRFNTAVGDASLNQ
jgi:hypothetical protein